MNLQIKQYLEKGYVHKLSQEEIEKPESRVWYLPIFPVRNPNKPDKIRIVWDAAAKTNGVSLNTLLLKGADLKSSLLGVMLRCRERNICILCDIREMYHQVEIAEKDQDVMRFLWRDGDSTRSPDTYKMRVMSFGATCSPSCAQCIKNQNAIKFINDYPRASIVDNHYVDDLLDSVDTEAEAIKLANKIRFIHENAGFEIRNWRSNSQEVMKELTPTTNFESTNKDLNPESSVEKVLGMWWCLDTDEFTFSLRYNKGQERVLKGQKRPTKRELLRILMSIYDPLGLIAQYLVQLKSLIQDLWRSQLDWDEPINDEHVEAWQMWLEVLPKVENLKIRRCYLNNLPNWDGVQTQLHVFVDASEKVCATVAYLRLKKADMVECVLVGSKTKIAPIKLRTIPRLELDAAIMGARFAKQLRSHLSIKIVQTIYWSDSKTVLSWLKSDPRQYNKYVAFRIAEVQDNSEVKDWRYVPSRLNVADEATKWSKTPKLESTERWYRGPDFLYYDESQWPKDVKICQGAVEELMNVHVLTEPFINSERFSKWRRLLNVVTCVIRAGKIWKAKTFKFCKPVGDYTSCEFAKAELLLFKTAQKESFPDEINYLRDQSDAMINGLTPTVSKTSKLYHLSPYLDDEDILRVRGRIDAADYVDQYTRRPVILPRDHRITHLLIQKAHEDLLHQNNETVVNNLRQRFYIPKLRCVLKTVIRNCQECKLRKAKPVVPEMSALPAARISAYTEPFTYVGIDCFGPMTVMVGRRTEKRWGVIFTCLTVRAVHIEVAYKLDTDAFILCFHDFMARRGQPREIFCDRGTNFIGAERMLREELQNIDFKCMAKHFVSPTLKWNFNPPASPHMGGSWERLIRSLKISLYGSLPSKTPTDAMLKSCLISAEAIVNSRPLTYLPMDCEQSEALTPNHFIRSSSSGNKPCGQFSDDVKILKHDYQYKEQFANRCWKRFIIEYLPELTLRSKWFKQTQPLKVGDIVMIIDKDLPRNNYPKGKIIEVRTAADGQVRSATVQTQDGILTRPAVKIARIEVQGPEVGMTSPTHDDAIPGGTVDKSCVSIGNENDVGQQGMRNRYDA